LAQALNDAVERPEVGKTHIAVVSGMEGLRRGYTVRYTTLDDLLVRAFRKADKPGKLREMLSYYQRAQLLIRDEGGAND
jgi:DNA replication protein DnaC